jgi:hypothetical protein
VGFEHGGKEGLEGGVVDRVEVEAEELAGLVFGLLGEVGEVDVEGGWSVRGGGEELVSGEFVADVGGAGGGGVDEADFVADEFLEDGDEEGVVGAAEEEGVDVALQHRLEVFFEDEFEGGVIEPALLDEGDEEGSGAGVDLEVGSAEGEVVLVGVAFDGAFGADDADALAVGGGEGGGDAGFEDAEDGDAEGGAEGVESVGGGGVAGDDDGFDALVDQELGVFEGEAADGFRGLGAVGDAGGVAEVDDGFVGEELAECADDGEAADAGVEDAEGGGFAAGDGRWELGDGGGQGGLRIADCGLRISECELGS